MGAVCRGVSERLIEEFSLFFFVYSVFPSHFDEEASESDIEWIRGLSPVY
jgi:hypothetical protein